MKKTTLMLVASALMAEAATAQSTLNLTGSSYYQSFDGVASGLPAGWEIDSNATATSRGAALVFNTAATVWKQPTTTNGKGLNFAAKNGFTDPATTAAVQAAATNRAMGLRQVATIDSQVAFTLTLAQTTGLTNFNLSFLLQSLDTTSPRIATWEVQYGIGASPTTFTRVAASGTLTSGGSRFSSNLITASLGTALSNQPGPVVIRIVAPHKSSGAAGRPSTAIDSFTLSWTGTAFNNRPGITSLSPANRTANVSLSSTLSISFDKAITAGPGSIYIKDATAQTTVAKMANSSDVTISGATANIANSGLVAGHKYRVSFDSTAFKSGVYACSGIYDSSSWVFRTQGPVVTVQAVMEYFDAACASDSLPAGWSTQNAQGAGEQWSCYTDPITANAAMQMHGYSAGSYNVNEDWLITPRINLSGVTASKLSFVLWKQFAGDELHLLYCTDYDGMSAPATAAWTDLNIPMLAADTGYYKRVSAPLPAQVLFVAFRYTSTASSAYQIRIDSVNISGTMGIAEPASPANSMAISVLGIGRSRIEVAFEAQNAGAVNAAVYDLTGRVVYHSQMLAVKGKNTVVLRPEDLQSGMYLIRISDGKAQGVVRAFVH